MLVRQRSLDVHLPRSRAYPWFAALLLQFGQRFFQPAGTAEGFPCVFAQNAFKRRNVVFSLVPLRGGAHDLDELRLDLADYLDEGADWDGSPNTSEPLLAVFEPTPSLRDANDYGRLFDQSLQHLMDNDPQPWPEHTHTDPASPFWSMCFNGTQIFVNVSHPAHVNRRSRNLCDTLVLVINPRERFDRVAGDNDKGNAIRQQIRHNVEVYDGMPHSPLLDHYLSGGLEWPQYDLPDHNSTPARRCPLHFSKKGRPAQASLVTPSPVHFPAPHLVVGLPAARYRFAR